jgi:uncharacterized glyoxalase superfamily protein PhnB
MDIKAVSAAFTTNMVEESRDFYVKYFDAIVTFDCGWYVNLKFKNEYSTLQFMSPISPEHKLSISDGLMYNFMVDDVDKVYSNFNADGLPIIIPIDNHPWGDRGFWIKDPNGISLYIFSEREPTNDFKKYYK